METCTDDTVLNFLQFHQSSASLDQASLEGNSLGWQCREAAPFMGYDQACSGFFAFEGPLPLQLLPPADGEASSSNAAQSAPPPLLFDQPPYPLINFPGWPERYVDVGHGFVDAGAMDGLAYQELLPMVQSVPMIMPFFGMECAHDAVKHGAFDDLPPNMFDDAVDQPPPPPPPPPPPSPSPSPSRDDVL
jgi:myb proto-oncogene protein